MTALENIIRERIAAQGRITFAEFMEAALYYPGRGYYTSERDRVGAAGDFYTSPATHPVFAALIGRQLEQMWRLLGCPASFGVLEMGAGRGPLARDLLGYLPELSPEFASAVSYAAGEKDSLTVLQGAADFDNITGCIMSNELLDALPVHRVTVRGGLLQEIYVTLRGDELVEALDGPSTPELAGYLAAAGVELPEGYRTEINLNIRPWAGEVSRRLSRGFVLTIDYGLPARHRYSPERRGGTLATCYRHTSGSNPYIHIGEQDITSHVDFSGAARFGEEKGLDPVCLMPQRDFLLNLGLDSYIRTLPRESLSYDEYLANRMAMLELVKPEGLGGFGVLIQSRAARGEDLYCLRPDNALKAQDGPAHRAAPLLRDEHTPLLRGKYPHYQSLDGGG
ncbi:MAG: SAM-dependent methyltransferase [Chloroflexi bacterium]|nr:SAM-dependent methyltransferase [Chloroflexota bacterium]